MPEILLTGASGFLGRAIARRAIASGMRVRAYGRSRPPAGEWFPGALTERRAVESAATGAGVLIHAAGLAHQTGRPALDLGEAFRAVNVVGTEIAVAAALEAGVRTIVLVSSAAVYGYGEGAVVDEGSLTVPADPYGASKLEAERVALRLIAAAPVPVSLAIVRPVTILGEGDPGNVLRLVRAIDRGRFIWIGRGDNRKSFVDREEVAGACVRLAECAIQGTEVFNLARQHPTVRDFVNAIASLLGRRIPPWRIPVQPLLVLGESGAWRRIEPERIAALRESLRKWVTPVLVGGKKFAHEVGYDPEIDLQTSLDREIAWYRSGCPPGK